MWYVLRQSKFFEKMVVKQEELKNKTKNKNKNMKYQGSQSSGKYTEIAEWVLNQSRSKRNWKCFPLL